MPNMTVIDPCDALETEQVVPAIAAHKGRSTCGSCAAGAAGARRVRLPVRARQGEGHPRRPDVLVISSGLLTMRALETAKALEADKVSVAVLHVPTIKPLDTETILREAGRTGRMVVVAENHTVIGGLGEAVAGVLLRAGVTPKFRHIGLPDEFLAAGALPTLHDRYGISAARCPPASKAGSDVARRLETGRLARTSTSRLSAPRACSRRTSLCDQRNPTRVKRHDHPNQPPDLPPGRRHRRRRLGADLPPRPGARRDDADPRHGAAPGNPRTVAAEAFAKMVASAPAARSSSTSPAPSSSATTSRC